MCACLRVRSSVMCCSFVKGCDTVDLEERIMELSRYGYACGQILAILLLDTMFDRTI